MRRVALAAVLVALALTSCGDPSMTRSTSRDLRSDVADIRAAAEDGRAFLAKQRLTALAAKVGELLDTGELDTATAAEIVDAIDVVRAALPSLPEPSPTVTETTPPPVDTEEGGDGDEGGGNGNAYGKDKDKGGGNGNESHGNDD